MKNAGGVLAIIAGLLGLAAGVATLLMGGLGAAFSDGKAGLVVGLGWGGIVFSLLVLVYGALAFAAPRAAAVGLGLSAAGGAVLGGTLVAALMLLALIAAAMVWRGRPKTPVTGGGAPGDDLGAASRPAWRGMATAAAMPLLAGFWIGGQVSASAKPAEPASAPSAAAAALAPGQTARSPRFEVTLRGARFADRVGRGFGETHAAPGTVFAVLDVSARCVDNESRLYTAGDLLVELDGRSLRFDRSETILGLDSPAGMINPLTEKAGFVVYQIPQAAMTAPMFWTPGRGFEQTRFALVGPAAIPAPGVGAVSAVVPPIAVPTAAPAAPALVPPATRGDLSPGRYIGELDSSLEILPGPNGNLAFALFAVGPTGNTGEVAGDLAKTGDGWAFENAEPDCRLRLRQHPQGVAVEQRGLCGFGMNVFGAGVYRRASAG